MVASASYSKVWKLLRHILHQIFAQSRPIGFGNVQGRFNDSVEVTA